MEGRMAEKAKKEIEWEKARAFARGLESMLKGGKAKIPARTRMKIKEFLASLGEREGSWIKDVYKKSGEKERKLFLKALMYFIFWLGTEKTGQRNLKETIGRMSRDGARLGEFYDYLVQYRDKKIKGRGVRLASLVSAMDRDINMGEEYYSWFSEEFNIPPEGVWTSYPTFFTGKTPKELRDARKKINWRALRNILSSVYGMYVGHAALGRIEEYVKNGQMAKLAFQNKKRAARIASLLFQFGIKDISQNGNKLSLGLRETIYQARKQVEGGPAIELNKRFLERYLKYFTAHGLDRGKAEEITRIFERGNKWEAIDRMCRMALRICKKEYLVMGEKKYKFGKMGKKMVSDFKKNVGKQGDASLLKLYEMIAEEDYTRALHRLRAILDSIDSVREGYPNIFSS
ncbi:MAG: hypothetical protein ACLFUZ_01375 [Candidatus Micrarchaeia archaeon]